MNRIEDAAVYRICAVNEHRWDVLRDPCVEPVASFTEKHAALAYAMSLARGRATWQLLGDRPDALGNILSFPRGARGTRI
jgi:hypothetical protein